MRRLSRLIAPLFAGSALLVAGAASAQPRIPANDWRQKDRPLGRERYESPESFAVELRFGPYYPEVDEELADKPGSPTPYKDVFGDSAQVYFGLEFDWLPLRIPYVGLFGPGLGWGYTRTSAPAMKKDTCQPGVPGTCVESSQDTAFTVLPMHLSAVLRADYLMRQTGIPIVPYGKLGIGFATWSVSTANGISDADDVQGRGITWGIHMALGGMLSLGWLDPRYAAALDENTGVNHVYVFGEWMNAQLDGLGSKPQMHVGTSTWVLGLAMDM
jgi:hypothetical protein